MEIKCEWRRHSSKMVTVCLDFDGSFLNAINLNGTLVYFYAIQYEREQIHLIIQNKPVSTKETILIALYPDGKNISMNISIKAKINIKTYRDS